MTTEGSAVPTTAVPPRAGTGHPLALPALVLGAAALGVSTIFVRLTDVGPFASAFWRVALALPLILVWALRESGPAAIAAAFRSPAVLLAGLFFAGDLIFWHLSLTTTTIANATFLATMAPIWVVLGSWLFIGEPVERHVVFGLFVCLAGAALLIGGSWHLAPERLAGDLYGIVTSLFFGGYFLSVRVARRGHGSGPTAFAGCVATTAVLLVAAVIAEPVLLPATVAGAAALIGLAVLGQAAGQGLLAFALGHVSAAFSSLVIFLEAVAAAVVAWMVFDERLTLDQGLGGLMILAGIVAARPRPAAVTRS